MLNRILTGWTFTRMLYTFIGVMVIVQGFMEKQYWGMAFGVYFASMGIFNFGCAAGVCYGGNCQTQEPLVNKTTKTDEVAFEEIKSN